MGLEDPYEASRRAWLASIEQFCKIIEEQLRQAREGHSDEKDLLELEELHLKILRMWKRRIPNPPRRKKENGCKPRWTTRTQLSGT